MTLPGKNILYIGPYKEESNRGYYSYMNIKALERAGHNLKIIPRFSYRYINNNISKDILHLENTNFERYDVCIQHCDSIQYTYNSGFSQNIGIYDFANFNPNPIVNSNLVFLDKIIVSSKNKIDVLQETLSSTISQKLQYLPQLIDIDKVKNRREEKLSWIDDDRFYFYSELDFSEQYDWEKLIYIYLTRFMNKKTCLVIKTKKLDNDKKIDLIKKQVHDMAVEANVKAIPEAMPKVLNGASNHEELEILYNSMNCLVDVNKANEQSYSSVYFAAMEKPIICNRYLTTASYFDNSFKTEPLICNSSMIYYDDILNGTIRSYYYTSDSESLEEQMFEVYSNRNSYKHIRYQEIENHDISNINDIL